MADYDPYAMMATNPYLSPPQAEPPNKLALIGQMLTGLGAGIGAAQSRGLPWHAGIGPGAGMATAAIGSARQQREAEAMKRWQMGLMARQYQDKQEQARRDSDLGDQIGAMVGLNVRPNPVRMGPGDPAEAIAGIESGGRYDAVGPVANRKGSRAYGKYQVMDFNVGPWTKEVLGTEMTPQEFLASPQAQDAVFKAKFGQYAQKHGPGGAARAWFAGEGGMNNPDAADVNGMTVANYEQKFNARMPQIAQGDAISGQGDAPGGAPGISRSAIEGLAPEVRASIGVMAKRNPDKALQMLVQAIQNQKKEDAWVPLDARNRQMFPNLDPKKEYLRNLRTGDIKTIGGSLVTVNTGDALLPGQKKVDEKFADQYIEFVTGGGFSDSVKMLEQLKEVRTALKSGASLTGPIIGMQGDTLLSFTNPDAMAMRDAVFEVAQRNLRLVLGAQFTAKEGEQLIARTYNPRLSEEENAKRVDRLMRQIETAVDAKVDSAKYFEEHGTLRGWKGKLPSMADFEPPPLPKETPKKSTLDEEIERRGLNKKQTPAPAGSPLDLELKRRGL